MRITLQTQTNRALADTQRQTAEIARLQRQSATGQRLTAPSDDPALAGVLDANAAQEGRLATYLDNIRSVRGTMDLGVSMLLEAGNVLVSARETAIEGSQSGLDAAARETFAKQVDR